MKTIPIQIIAIVSTLCIKAALAAPNEGVSLYGVGINSCGSFLEATKGENTGLLQRDTGRVFFSKRSLYSEWLFGYVTAFNVMNFEKSNIRMINTDVDGLMAWVTSYCQKNPLNAVERAANALVRSHIVER